MADRSKEIEVACSRQNERGRGVLPPQVCFYCFGCPIATLVAGVTDNNTLSHALPIPDAHIAEVDAWLERLNRRD
jgi:hypothetical protein